MVLAGHAAAVHTHPPISTRELVHAARSHSEYPLPYYLAKSTSTTSHHSRTIESRRSLFVKTNKICTCIDNNKAILCYRSETETTCYAIDSYNKCTLGTLLVKDASRPRYSLHPPTPTTNNRTRMCQVPDYSKSRFHIIRKCEGGIDDDETKRQSTNRLVEGHILVPI